MRFPDPLLAGRLLRRYKRFFAEVELTDGAQVLAHCPNPGSMLGLALPGAPAWLSPSRNPARKLAYTLELIEAEGTLVGVNTAHPNALVAEALSTSALAEFRGYQSLRREVRYGRNSRVDFLLEGDAGRCYLEVKNVHLRRRPGRAEFPDSVTLRGAKHLEELGDMAAEGARALVLYLVQRGDCNHFAIAADIDPGYARAMQRAQSRGVEFLCYSCEVTPQTITLAEPLPIEWTWPEAHAEEGINVA
jgi:sugar fermentation stimulation protein A